MDEIQNYFQALVGIQAQLKFFKQIFPKAHNCEQYINGLSHFVGDI